MTLLELLVILAVCLMSEGFFTGTELAVVNADKLKLRSRARKGSKTAQLALDFQTRPGWFFSATLLGTNLSLVTASVCTTYYIVRNFGEDYEGWAILLSPILLIFGEIIPKSIFQHNANRIVDRIVYPVKIFGTLLYPVVYFLSKLNDIFIGRISRQYKEEPPVTRDELEALIEERAKDQTEGKPIRHHTIISNIFDLADKKVSNIMTPLVEVEALSLSTKRKEALRVFERSGHTRFPIFQRRIVNIIGILHTIDFILSDQKREMRDLMRPAYFVPEEMPVDDLLVMMKRKGEPLAVVVDEFGGASGIVTLEDVLEEIIGEIPDEYDTPDTLYYRIGKGIFMVNGRLEILQANAKLKFDLPEGDYETVAGFLIHQLGRIPQKNTRVQYGKLLFIVHEANERAIQEVEVRVG